MFCGRRKRKVLNKGGPVIDERIMKLRKCHNDKGGVYTWKKKILNPKVIQLIHRDFYEKQKKKKKFKRDLRENCRLK